VQRRGGTLAVRSGGKTEALLQTLALRRERMIPRETVLAEVWPEVDPSLSGPALNSLVYNLHNQLGKVLDGAAPVINAQGAYRLNREAGVDVDIACFEAHVADGDFKTASGTDCGIDSYIRALAYYRGDLCAYLGDFALVERERLRASYLTLLARAAAHYFSIRDYDRCLEMAFRLLAGDACREDAYRLVMLCYVARGERAQALRQYRVCENILRSEFDAAPELATVRLFDRIRLDPGGVSSQM
jgi:DNA-binding SARP family transcriptional activator